MYSICHKYLLLLRKTHRKKKSEKLSQRKCWEVIGHTVPSVCPHAFTQRSANACGNKMLLLRDMLFNKQ